MSKTLERVRVLVVRGQMRVSFHTYEKLAADSTVQDIIDGFASAAVVEVCRGGRDFDLPLFQHH